METLKEHTMVNQLINSAKLYLLALAVIGSLVACGPSAQPEPGLTQNSPQVAAHQEESIQEENQHTANPQEKNIQAENLQNDSPQEDTPQKEDPQEEDPKPTPYPTVCVVIEGPIGTFQDECITLGPDPTVPYNTIYDPRLMDRVQEYEEQAADPRRSGDPPNPNKVVYVTIQTHPGRMDEVVDWLNDNDSVDVWGESNYIGAGVRIGKMVALDQQPGVKNIKGESIIPLPGP